MTTMRRALILAAGRGERMLPLTATTPKPLLAAGGMRLIEWQIAALVRAGVRDIVINIAHLAHTFAPALGDGARYGATLHYSHEGDEPLETGGGVMHALPLLGDGPFIAVNGDIWCDFDLTRLPAAPRGMAHLVLVDNPVHNPQGDFVLHDDGRLEEQGTPRLTFSGIGVYTPAIFEDWRAIVGERAGAQLQPPRFPLAPLLYAAARRGALHGEHHAGRWTDVGTPQRLAELDATLRR
jgi:N-acetyl-alpha-D-muramate 1-phosphate uridylyltransferase